jgi:secreted trypsin-like serine protease
MKLSSTGQMDSALNIVNGSVVQNNDPLERSTAAVVIDYKMKSGERRGGICTGAVAGRNVVLTAGHCFIAPEGAVQAQYFITFKPELVNLRESDVIAVEKVEVHPNFGKPGSEGNFDIALLRLSKDIPSTQNVASFVSDVSRLTSGTPVSAIGYGVTGTNNQDSGTKRRTETQVVNLVNPTNYPNAKLDNQVRVRDSGGRGACYGDSGGPGFLKDSPQVFGLVQGAASVTSGVSANCEAADYNYTLVAPYLGWVEETIGYKLNVSGNAQSIAEASSWLTNPQPQSDASVKAAANSEVKVSLPSQAGTDSQVSRALSYCN